MRSETPFNPLDRTNLGVSVADALLSRSVHPLPPQESFGGAGVYAIYYVGDFLPYDTISSHNRLGKFQQPIYVGKAVPAGARKGNFGLGLAAGPDLWKRLSEHSKSINQATNLQLEDFFCRYLVVEDIWIPLGESLLVQRFAPAWNVLIDGFGNHDPGSGRYDQQRSNWDVLHPGRPWAEKLTGPGKPQSEILKMLEQFLEAQSRNDSES